MYVKIMDDSTIGLVDVNICAIRLLLVVNENENENQYLYSFSIKFIACCPSLQRISFLKLKKPETFQTFEFTYTNLKIIQRLRVKKKIGQVSVDIL